MDDWIKLLIILLVVPLQYMITEHYNAPDVGSTRSMYHGGRGYLRLASDWLTDWTQSSSLPQQAAGQRQRKAQATAQSTHQDTAFRHNNYEDDDVDSADNWFSGSKSPRRDRTGIQFRVGQVVQHKRYGYRGVIVGWDTQPRAPDRWFKQMGVGADMQQDPFYSVLVDTRDRDEQQTYVWQGNLKVVKSTAEADRIQHPEVTSYFKRYSNGLRQYEPEDYLRRRYPKD
eukprot:TRINITY_DN1555_c0_g1_i1.p1 TRINITY_DN1555_c0_g1~~TRINITY_DN1555_c0_g1_i1.p1  ORF type:complete len:228 (+),score=39.04 TRINITY_DN1555_c0_g1_i1:79-762(+)